MEERRNKIHVFSSHFYTKLSEELRESEKYNQVTSAIGCRGVSWGRLSPMLRMSETVFVKFNDRFVSLVFIWDM